MMFGASVSQLMHLTCIRPFSTSPLAGRELAHIVRRKTKQPRQLEVGDPDTLLPSTKPQYPPYPYGDAQIYKQSNRGLYGGKMIQFGHKISEKFDQKSGRVFYPNIQKTVLYSDALKRRLSIKLATSVLRTITKEGGLDNYLTKDTPARIKELGPFGWQLRFDVLTRLQEIERTAPKILPGLTVGKARLIKDLFSTANKSEDVPNFYQFRLKYRDASTEDLLSSLESAGVDISKYRSTE